MNASESHLSVIIDLSPSQWHLSSLPLDLFISQLLTFLNAHIALKHENTLAVFAALPGKSVMLYASSDPQNQSQPIDSNTYQPFKLLDSTVVSRISHELDQLSQEDPEAPSALVGALTKALCYINRISIGSSTTLNHVVDPRILILSVSSDLSTSYIPIMNSIFSAQKLKVTIDACQIFGPETVFLQQAAHLTGGAYLYLERREALLQYLIMTFLPPSSIRKVLAIPTQDRIDFRAACFCHKNIIDIGFVCSVCLSIFCQPVPVCSTCRTKFPIKTLQRLNASRPMLPVVTNSVRPSPVSTPTPTPLSHPSPMERVVSSRENAAIGTQPTNGSQH